MLPEIVHVFVTLLSTLSSYYYALMVIVYLFLFAASKHPRLDIDQAVDDVLPLSVAQKFRDRLKEQQRAEASTSTEEADKRKTRGKKVDHL